jgi:hypothetical protein
MNHFGAGAFAVVQNHENFTDGHIAAVQSDENFADGAFYSLQYHEQQCGWWFPQFAELINFPPTKKKILAPP